MNGSIECAFSGRVGNDPELRTTKTDKRWLKFTVAVGLNEATQWVSIACFGSLAERLAGELKKGGQVYVEGRLKLDEWTGRDGEKRTGLSVTASRVEVLGQIGRAKPPRKPKSLRQVDERGTNGQVDAAALDWQRPPAGDEIPF